MPLASVHAGWRLTGKLTARAVSSAALGNEGQYEDMVRSYSATTITYCQDIAAIVVVSVPRLQKLRISMVRTAISYQDTRNCKRKFFKNDSILVGTLSRSRTTYVRAFL